MPAPLPTGRMATSSCTEGLRLWLQLPTRLPEPSSLRGIRKGKGEKCNKPMNIKTHFHLLMILIWNPLSQPQPTRGWLLFRKKPLTDSRAPCQAAGGPLVLWLPQDLRADLQPRHLLGSPRRQDWFFRLPAQPLGRHG